MILDLKAWDSEKYEFDVDLARAIGQTGLVKVVAGTQDWWRVEADSHVGVAIGNGWELRVRPRLAIPKLLFLLAYSRDPSGWRNAVAGFDVEDDLLSAVATGFAHHCDEALRPGVLYGYVAMEERLTGLRGRVRFADQLARNPGLPLPLEVAYDDFTADIPENRLLRTAGELLLRVSRVPAAARTKLLRMRALLEDVTVIADRRSLKRPEPTRLNQRYTPALVLAELIVRSASISAERGPVSSTTFAFDMNEVFESFLFTALSESFRRHHGRLERHLTDHLDEERGLTLKPDITWVRGGRRAAVIDAKYKSLVDKATMPNADAYQMLAYCIALDLPCGFLVYAKDAGERVRRHKIRRHNYDILVRSIDVELEPDDLLRQVGAIADEVAASTARGAIAA